MSAFVCVCKVYVRVLTNCKVTVLCMSFISMLIVWVKFKMHK